MRFRSALATICTVVVATSGLAATAGGAVEPASADRYIGANSLVMGSTLTHWSFDGTTRQQGPADTEATERGLAQLHDASGYINVHLHGWGTGAPITKDGTPRWDDLDRRFGMIEASRPRTGPQPAIVLTACCSPRNFVDPKWGDKEWYPKPPLPQNYGAYAELVAETVNRYPQISYVQVWNEMKGFSGPNRAQDYTNLYNAIWNAVKNPKVVDGITVRP